MKNISINANDIYNYMVEQLAQGVSIGMVRRREMLQEIQFMIDTD